MATKIFYSLSLVLKMLYTKNQLTTFNNLGDVVL